MSDVLKIWRFNILYYLVTQGESFRKRVNKEKNMKKNLELLDTLI